MNKEAQTEIGVLDDKCCALSYRKQFVSVEDKKLELHEFPPN